MSRQRLVRACLPIGLLMTGLVLLPYGSAQPPKQQPKPLTEEVANLLIQEPMTLHNWTTWRGRLTAWLNDHNDATAPAFYVASDFVKKQVDAKGELPPPLSNDGLAWYLLGSAYWHEATQTGAKAPQGLAQAEQALRRSLRLQPDLASARARLASLCLWMEDANPARLEEARKELEEAKRQQPNLPDLAALEGELALRQHHWGEAQKFLEQAMREEPAQPVLAVDLAYAILANKALAGSRSARVQPLLDRLPDNGQLVALHAVALAQDGHAGAAGRELRRARRLGTDPAQVLPAQVVQQIESAAAPWLLLGDFGRAMLGFAITYAVAMALMAGAGVLLARRTRGSAALQLLGTAPEELVTEGQVARAHGESALARVYALALVLGLVGFYVSIPFLIAGLVTTTGLLLYGIFLLPRIPVKLIVIVVVIGLGCAWAVVKSLFSRRARGSFGIPKTATDCPRLYQCLADVAGRVDTQPVDEVFLAPGAAIGVHQEGRGPFGIFGVKRRVLTLGLSTLHYLSIVELQSILAHEYAHFSHKDTFYNRFIYQVSLSIQQALVGMAQSGGSLNYVNPFFWFLYLYHRAYTLLSAGYSRSREFLADRMAAILYGSDIFAGALAKVCTDGTLFEMTIYQNIAQLLEEQKCFANMYSAFRAFRDEQLGVEKREELYQKLLEETESVFATHPTFRERVEAVASLPRAQQVDSRPALELFEQPEEIEKQLTEFLTGYIYHVRQLHAQAAAAGGGEGK